MTAHAKVKARTMMTAAVLIVASVGMVSAETRSFSSPQEGFSAFASAVKRDNVEALDAMLGPDGREILSSGDPVEDANSRKRFTAAYDARNVVTPLDNSHSVLAVGPDGWEFPIPMAKQGGAWRFDTSIGKAELLNRRIGRNEIAAIQACLAYVDAQKEFASRSGGYYAQRFVSSPGKQDGLYWPTKSGEAESPLGPLFAQAQAAGYKIPGATPEPSQPTPYYGYLYRILTMQGASASGGRRNYVVSGKMTGGFALVATPATYGASGIMTFMVNQDGQVYQRDLGEDTVLSARTMASFDPDKNWKPVEPEATQAVQAE
jgi:hypothetical protein